MMPIQHPHNRLAQIHVQVEAVGHLHRLRIGGSDPVGEDHRAVTCHHLDLRLGSQPVSSGITRPLGQNVHYMARLMIDDHGAIVMSFAEREIVNADGLRVQVGLEWY